MELKLDFEGFEGHVTMTVATNIDRIEIMEKLGINMLDVAGDKSGKLTESLQKMSTLLKMLKISKKYYVSVDLEKDGKKFESFDDLNNDPKCQSVMMICATKCLHGIGVEEEKK